MECIFLVGSLEEIGYCRIHFLSCHVMSFRDLSIAIRKKTQDKEEVEEEGIKSPVAVLGLLVCLLSLHPLGYISLPSWMMRHQLSSPLMPVALRRRQSERVGY